MKYYYNMLINILYGTELEPAPASTNELDSNKIKDGGKSQNERLFNLGNAISTAPINKGTKKFNITYYLIM